MATYVERRLFGTRTFRLFPSALELIGRQGTVRFNLGQLLSNPTTGRTIDATARQRLWVAALAMFILYLLVPATQAEFIAILRGLTSPLGFLVAKGVYLATMAVLLALAVLRSKQYEFAAFEYEPGNPAFHVLKLGNAADSYEEFVSTLCERIAASRSSGGTAQ